VGLLAAVLARSLGGRERSLLSSEVVHG
jgi:hypothetical protein